MKGNPLIQEFRRAGCVDDDSAIGIQIAEIFNKYYKKLYDKNIICAKEDAKGCLYSLIVGVIVMIII